MRGAAAASGDRFVEMQDWWNSIVLDVLHGGRGVILMFVIVGLAIAFWGWTKYELRRDRLQVLRNAQLRSKTVDEFANRRAGTRVLSKDADKAKAAPAASGS